MSVKSNGIKDHTLKLGHTEEIAEVLHPDPGAGPDTLPGLKVLKRDDRPEHGKIVKNDVVDDQWNQHKIHELRSAKE